VGRGRGGGHVLGCFLFDSFRRFVGEPLKALQPLALSANCCPSACIYLPGATVVVRW
jgi:hypothetical protein